MKELRAYKLEGNEFSDTAEVEIIKRLTFSSGFIVSNGLLKDYFENFIKYGNEEISESAIDSLTERLIAGEGNSIEMIPLDLLDKKYVPSTICEALNFSELKVNNMPKPKTAGDLLFRFEGAARRSTSRRFKSLEACISGFEKLLK